jgi:hypothetical protein
MRHKTLALLVCKANPQGEIFNDPAASSTADAPKQPHNWWWKGGHVRNMPLDDVDISPTGGAPKPLRDIQENGAGWVFTDTALRTGAWRAVQQQAEDALRPVRVALSESNAAHRLQLLRLERDAFDGILATAESKALEYVIYSSTDCDGNPRLALTRLGHA